MTETGGTAMRARRRIAIVGALLGLCVLLWAVLAALVSSGTRSDDETVPVVSSDAPQPRIDEAQRLITLDEEIENEPVTPAEEAVDAMPGTDYFSNTGIDFEKRRSRLMDIADSGGPQAAELILDLAQAEIYMNRFAVEALGRLPGAMNDGKVTSFLQKTAFHDDALMATAAIRALANTGDDRAGEILLSSIQPNHNRQDGHEEMVCTAIVEVVPLICGPAAAETLAVELEMPGTDGWTLEYGSKVLWALDQFRNPVAIPQVESYLERLRSARPDDPLGGRYYDAKISEAQEILHVLKSRM